MKIRGIDYGIFVRLQNEESINNYLATAFEQDLIQQSYNGSFMSRLCHVARLRSMANVEEIARQASISTGSFHRMERGKQGNATLRSAANLLAVSGLRVEFRYEEEESEDGLN